MKDELLSIKGLGKAALSKLTLAGITGLNDLSNKDISELSQLTGIPLLKLRGWQTEAKNLLGIKETEQFNGIDALITELSKKDSSASATPVTFNSIKRAAQAIDAAISTIPRINKRIGERSSATEPEKEPEVPPPVEQNIGEAVEPVPKQIKTEEPAASDMEEMEESNKTGDDVEVIDLIGETPVKHQNKAAQKLHFSSIQHKNALIVTLIIFALIFLSIFYYILPTYKNYVLTSKTIRLIFQGNTEKINTSISRMKPTYTNLIHISTALIANKRFDAARTLLNKAGAINPNSPTPNNLLAGIFLRLNDFGAAYLQTMKAQKKDPQNKDIHKNLSIYYLKTGDLPQAAGEAQIFIKLKPKSAIGHLNYAKILIKLNRTKQATKQLTLSLKFAKSDLLSSSVLEEIGDAYVRKGTFRNAIPPYMKSLRQNPENINTMYKLANVYNELDKNAKAIKLLKYIWSNHPDYLPAALLLGKIYYKKSEPSIAESYFRKVIKKDYNNHEAIYYLALIYYAEGNYLKASVFLKKSIIIGIDEPKIYYSLAYISYYENDFQKSYNYLKEIEQYLPNNYKYFYFLAYISLRLGKLNEANNYYRQCVTLNSNDGTVYNNLGVINELKKRYRDAESYYFNAAQILAPQGIEAPVNINALNSTNPSVEYAKMARSNYYRMINRRYIKSLSSALKKIIFIPSPKLGK